MVGKHQASMGRWGRRVECRVRERIESYQSRAAQENDRMFTESAVLSRGTRVRAVPLVGVGLVTLGFLVSMVYQNVLAVNFTTGNNEFKIYSNYLDAYKAAGYLAPSGAGGNTGVAEIGIAEARLEGLCVIAKDNLLGGLALKITAGSEIPDAPYGGTAKPADLGVEVLADDADGSDAGTVIGDTPGEKKGALAGADRANAITATKLFMNSKSLGGYGNYISGLNLGQAAGGVEAKAGVDIEPAPADAGNFGLYADQLNIAGLDGSSYGINLAGAITLPKLKLSVVSKAWGTDSLTGITQSDC